MYSRLRSSATRSKSASKSPKNKSYRVRDASMHSRSSSRGSKSDMDVDQPPKDKVNYATIEERKSEESDDSKNINLSSISEPQSQLSDQSSPEYSPLQQKKESWIVKRMLKFRRSITTFIAKRNKTEFARVLQSRIIWIGCYSQEYHGNKQKDSFSPFSKT